MKNRDKLLSLLQPIEYKSKIKLYCKDCKTKIIPQKVAQLKDNTYICKTIKIKEI